MKENNVDLPRVQARLLEMAKVVTSVLERNGVSYLIAHGTLIGAVRHGGFIPWDDDFDLLLFDETYERGLEVLRTALPADMFVEDALTEPMFFHGWARVKDLRTEAHYARDSFDRVYAHHGLCVDLLRCKKMPLSELRAYRLGEAEAYVERQQALGLLSAEEADKKRAVFAKQIGAEGEVGEDPEWSVLALSARARYYRCQDVFPLVRYRFADTEFWGPCDADTVLRQYFGDYMTLPPEQERVSRMAWVTFKDCPRGVAR